ncbi:Oidioi.mRNA.OKI2018_I69.chr1.g1866.t2.cds [Oikopleura dioica]|uniref:Uromodulin n=1 Tax=Oikopleura dioica TaxID=34765 RepID=A0ABN7STG9_OIKDI|nr:Oidioi.mRNA.OKI2018_I69.chr1.g1866.t2.cds [Oikopleura dioica]
MILIRNKLNFKHTNRKGRRGSHTFRDLSPGALYRLDIVPEDGERQVIKFNTKPIPVPKVSTSKFYRQAPDSESTQVFGAVLYWTPPAGALDGYAVSVQPNHGEIKAPVYQKNGESRTDNTQPRRVVTGLEPGLEYNFTIESTAGNEKSAPTIFNTRIPPETPGPIEVKSVDSRSAVLDWQREHRGFLDGFYLETVPPEGEMIRPKRNTDKQREVAGLKPGKKYTVKVHSTAYGLLSFRPSERSIITLPEAPLGDLVVISRDPVNVTLSWTPPDGEAQMYQILYYPTDSDARKLKELSINSTITLTNLDPGTEYNFEIETISNGLHSDSKSFDPIATPPLGIEDLTVIDKDFTSVSIGWNHPKPDNVKYVVDYSPNSRNSWPVGPFITTDTLAAVDGLEPGRTYVFNVYAVANNVESEPKKIKVTLPVPDKPSKVEISEVADTSFEITWESPYADATFTVDVLSVAGGHVDGFPISTSEKGYSVEGLDQGEVYKVTVSTVLDGFTTDKSAMQVETFKNSEDTILFSSNSDVEMEVIDATMNQFASYILNAIDDESISLGINVSPEPHFINNDKFAVLSVSIHAKPSVLSPEMLNQLFKDWNDDQSEDSKYFSDVIDTNLNECKMRNACSANSKCVDKEILYTCQCNEGYLDQTDEVVNSDKIYTLEGQVCLADLEDNCVNTDWKFQRQGYVVVRRNMPELAEFSMCFKMTLNSPKLQGTIVSYRHEGSKLLMYQQKNRLFVNVNGNEMYELASYFQEDVVYSICLAANDDLIKLIVNGETMQSLKPENSVKLLGGGKVQISHDSECNRKCERIRGDLDARIEDFTIWSEAKSTEELKNFAAGECLTNGIMTLEKEATSLLGPMPDRPKQESVDDLFHNFVIATISPSGSPGFADLATRRWTTPASPYPTPANDPTNNRFIIETVAPPVYRADGGEDHEEIARPTYAPLPDQEVSINNLFNTNVNEIIGKPEVIDSIKTHCNPDNMTIVAEKAMIDDYEKKYGPLALSDPSCGRRTQGKNYVWEISPDLLGCGSTLELTDTHVTFVNSLSTASSAEETITAKGGIIFGNQLSARQTTKVSMEVSCQFPLDYTVTAEYPFLPQISMNIIKFNVTDYGEFSALMQLFDTDAFERPFEGSPEIEEGELLNVGVSLLDVTDPNVRVTLQECWATPESSPAHELRHDLIADACGVPGVLDNTLDIVSNGDSRMAKWHGSVFKFVGYENVWLHCNIKVCFADKAKGSKMNRNEIDSSYWD